MNEQNMDGRDVVITGIGMVSALGVGAQQNWDNLSVGAAPVFDSEKFAPYTVHPLPEIDWAEQISKRDQRQMEAWQRIGTYTAGLALDDAGLKDKQEFTSTMDMIVAAAGGERDVDVDTMILAEAGGDASDAATVVNEKLTTELRPTLFLAQLSNLLAGNISIVHKVTGSSRTFMGEEGAGISAVLTAAARIRAGQSTHVLVGASFNTEHPDMLLGYEIGHHLKRDGWTSVWHRQDSEGGGIITGSGGTFLVLEARSHAEARGARIYATLESVEADQGNNDQTATGERLGKISAATKLGDANYIISAASGAKERTEIEKEFLNSALKAVPVRGVASAVGHMREVQFPFAVALAALSLHHEKPVEQMDSRFEVGITDKPERVGVLSLGYEDAEGAALLTPANGGKV
ncbi:beta-ketoacyl-ACP synthase [Ahrensia marina]|nr:beta-ketoacyl-ACP synthase [Ahrensia marina]